MLTPASCATSSRRRPGVRRRRAPAGSATSSGRSRSRRVRRKTASSRVTVSWTSIAADRTAAQAGTGLPRQRSPFMPALDRHRLATMTLSLDTYRLLGRSGLRVSPLALGAMTFGNDWGWGAERDEVRRILETYLDRGGNFVDTADVYTDGSSERLLGELLRGRRERVVLATKFTCSTDPGDPSAGGNHRRNMVRSVEASLRRLDTDYIDLLYLHAWDATTPVEEVLRGMDDLVRSGKVVYVGISDTPAWQVSRMQAIADL